MMAASSTLLLFDVWYLRQASCLGPDEAALIGQDNERAEEQGDNEPTLPEEAASEDRNGICTLERWQSCKP